jgi:hypothetical protein
MFFSLVDCHLAAQIADFGRNNPNLGEPALAWLISMPRWVILAQTIPAHES